MVVVEDHQQWEPSMGDITTIGLDLVKNVFQVHAVDEAGNNLKTAIALGHNVPTSIQLRADELIE